MTFYVDVDYLAAFRNKIVAAGGKIMADDQEVPGMGRLCLFTDPRDACWVCNSRLSTASPSERNNAAEEF